MQNDIKSWKNFTDIKDTYLEICDKASQHEDAFNTFKSKGEYSHIVATAMPQSFALNYYNLMKDQFPNILIMHEKFATNDMYGDSLIHTFDDVKLSFDTLRYMYTACKLVSKFGDLSELNIVEIGGGYGGQCKIISDLCKRVKSYTLIDLAKPLKLQSTYLQKFQLRNINFMDAFNYEPGKYDLVISQYAFSECGIDVQIEYYNKILKNCTHGYIVNNDLSIFHSPELFPEVRDLNFKVEEDDEWTKVGGREKADISFIANW